MAIVEGLLGLLFASPYIKARFSFLKTSLAKKAQIGPVFFSFEQIKANKSHLDQAIVWRGEEEMDGSKWLAVKQSALL